MSETTINNAWSPSPAESDELQRRVAELLQTRRNERAENEALKGERDASQALVKSLTADVAGWQQAVEAANERAHEAENALLAFKIQVRDAIVGLDLSREDRNAILNDLGLDPIVRRISGKVKITYSVVVDFEDVEVEDDGDEDDALIEAASNHDSSDIDSYELEFEDAEVEEWEEQDED